MSNRKATTLKGQGNGKNGRCHCFTLEVVMRPDTIPPPPPMPGSIQPTRCPTHPHEHPNEWHGSHRTATGQRDSLHAQQSPTRHRKRRHRPRNAAPLLHAGSGEEAGHHPAASTHAGQHPADTMPDPSDLPQNCFALYHYQR